jgi:hypothetical protein
VRNRQRGNGNRFSVFCAILPTTKAWFGAQDLCTTDINLLQHFDLRRLLLYKQFAHRNEGNRVNQDVAATFAHTPPPRYEPIIVRNHNKKERDGEVSKRRSLKASSLLPFRIPAVFRTRSVMWQLFCSIVSRAKQANACRCNRISLRFRLL